MPSDKPDYLTVRELAELLRVKERKVYDLAANDQIPHTRAMGKLLFPRHSVEAWLARHSSGLAAATAPGAAAVFAGSHDPLLDWALRESRCGIATFFDGSLDGLERMARGQAIAAGLHLHEPERNDWNRRHVEERLAGAPVVLVEWGWRERGLIVAPGNPLGLAGLADLVGRRVIPRQPEAGSQLLFDELLRRDGLAADSIAISATPARSEADLAGAVAEGKADAGFGLAALAAQFKLGFVPVIRERFDILVDRRAYFEPAFQSFVAFWRTDAFAAKALDLGGYDLSDLGRVRYNGA